MFTGIINIISNLFFLKYINFNTLVFIKILNYNFINFNIGESLSLNGVCLTLIYKNYNLMEFEISKETLVNINLIENNKFINTDKSLKFYSNLNGLLNLGHINNNFYLVSFIKLYKNYKIYIILKKFNYKFFLYKSSLNINGINLTVNEIEYFKNYLLLNVNLINFTYKFTSSKNFRILDIINLEVDIIFLYTFKISCLF